MRAPAWDPLPAIVVCGPRQPDGRYAGIRLVCLTRKCVYDVKLMIPLDALVGKASLGQLLAAVRCALFFVLYMFFSGVFTT